MEVNTYSKLEISHPLSLLLLLKVTQYTVILSSLSHRHHIPPSADLEYDELSFTPKPELKENSLPQKLHVTTMLLLMSFQIPLTKVILTQSAMIFPLSMSTWYVAYNEPWEARTRGENFKSNTALFYDPSHTPSSSPHSFDLDSFSFLVTIYENFPMA